MRGKLHIGLSGDRLLASRTPPSTYDPNYYARLFAIEDGHFWFRSRNLAIGALLRQVTAGLAPGYRVLEVGCGTGNTLRVLVRECADGLVVGMDMFSEGLRFARQRTRCSLVQGDTRALPFRGRFDVIGLFDVLEHVPDDERVLRDLRAALGPSGALLLTVPAHPFLWSYFDEASHHCRRYGQGELRQKLQGAGYRIEYLSQYMVAALPLVWAGRRLSAMARARWTGASHAKEMASAELRITPIVNEVLGLLLRWESHLVSRRVPLPVGTSLIALCRRG